jgi:hypothetical protein
MDAIRFPSQPTATPPARSPKALSASGVAALRAYSAPTPLRLQQQGDDVELSRDATSARITPKGDPAALRSLAAAKVGVTDELIQTVGAASHIPSAPPTSSAATPTRTASGAMALYRTAAQYNAAATGLAVGDRLDAQA